MFNCITCICQIYHLKLVLFHPLCILLTPTVYLTLFAEEFRFLLFYKLSKAILLNFEENTHFQKKSCQFKKLRINFKNIGLTMKIYLKKMFAFRSALKLHVNVMYWIEMAIRNVHICLFMKLSVNVLKYNLLYRSK